MHFFQRITVFIFPFPFFAEVIKQAQGRASTGVETLRAYPGLNNLLINWN